MEFTVHMLRADACPEKSVDTGSHMNTDLSPISSLMAWVHLRPAKTVHKATNVTSKPLWPSCGTSPVRCPSSKTGVRKNRAIASGLP